MTDFFLLLMLAGAGDELQGIKRGIMEMADLVAINKADGNNVEKAKMARIQYKNALHLFPAKDSGWDPQVLACSAWEKTGISEIWDTILKFRNLVETNGYFLSNRNAQARYWMYETIEEQLKAGFYNHPDIKPQLAAFENQVVNAKLTSYEAARKLLDRFYDSLNRAVK